MRRFEFISLVVLVFLLHFVEAKSKRRDTTGCVNLAKNCRQLSSRRLCNNHVYFRVMYLNCKVECHFCAKRKSEVKPRNPYDKLPSPDYTDPNDLTRNAPTSGCEDSSEHCLAWNNNGFCQSSFYEPDLKKQYCGRTCQLC
ncbi:hypothetical protein M3Y94_00994300 [Aphelenchoides besseyi]|nr:hypothetical protein M3Y94_00994300 [Aphelenchoides besseyi]